MLIDFPPANCLHSLPISCSYKYDNQENKAFRTAAQESVNGARCARLPNKQGRPAASFVPSAASPRQKHTERENSKKNPHLSKVPLSSVSDNPSPWQHCHSQRAQFTFNSHFLPSLSGQQLLALHQSPFIPVSFYKPKVRFPLPSHVMHWTEVLPAWLVQAMPKPSAPHRAAPPSLSLSSEAFSSRSAKKGGKKNEKKTKKRGVGESPNFPSVERTHPHRAPAREGAAPGHCRPQLSPARPGPHLLLALAAEAQAGRPLLVAVPVVGARLVGLELHHPPLPGGGPRDGEA